jgi:hypothetical protein
VLVAVAVAVVLVGDVSFITVDQDSLRSLLDEGGEAAAECWCRGFYPFFLPTTGYKNNHTHLAYYTKTDSQAMTTK